MGEVALAQASRGAEFVVRRVEQLGASGGLPLAQ